MNKNALRWRLNVCVERNCLRSGGSLFHARGAATQNALSPNWSDILLRLLFKVTNQTQFIILPDSVCSRAYLSVSRTCTMTHDVYKIVYQNGWSILSNFHHLNVVIVPVFRTNTTKKFAQVILIGVGIKITVFALINLSIMTVSRKRYKIHSYWRTLREAALYKLHVEWYHCK